MVFLINERFSSIAIYFETWRNCFNFSACWKGWVFRWFLGIDKNISRTIAFIFDAKLCRPISVLNASWLLAKSLFYSQNGSCVTTDFETLIRNFEVEKWNFELKLPKNFSNLPWDFILKFGLFFKFGVITWFTKQITKFVKRKFQERSEKFYEVPDWSFEVSLLSIILNLKFPIRVSK